MTNGPSLLVAYIDGQWTSHNVERGVFEQSEQLGQLKLKFMNSGRGKSISQQVVLVQPFQAKYISNQQDCLEPKLLYSSS